MNQREPTPRDWPPAALLIPILVLGGCAGVTPRPAAPGRFDRAIETLAALLESSYVIPAQGGRHAAMLRRNLARGAYAGIEGRGAIAARLTADLRAVAADGHLRVEPEGGAGPVRVARVSMGHPMRRPPPIEDAGWIADGVACIRFHEFPGDPDTVAAVDRFMADHAAARAIIIDARSHRGGGVAEMNVLLSYLFARETTLVFMDLAEALVRRKGPPPDDGPEVRRIAGPPGVFRREHVAIPNRTETRLFGAKVFYLVSSRTASAAEHLALALKRTHRAVLVGEHTAGANHFGGYEPLGDGLAVFLPVGRTLDPDTGSDWEGSGIQPDVAVPADRALDEALRLARSR